VILSGNEGIYNNSTEKVSNTNPSDGINLDAMLASKSASQFKERGIEVILDV
jgi:hypothetical protein